MFYKTIKDFLLKKHINKKLATGLPEVNIEPIKTIGLLIYGIDFYEKDKLIDEFNKQANGQIKINLLVYRKKANKEENIEYPYYSKKDISISGTISKGEIESFIKSPFDLLVNYYDTSNTDLELISVESKAKFKVGFASVNNDLNHFIISTYMEKYLDFTQVLFDYLKILKKI
jgi:hypothetical protein